MAAHDAGVEVTCPGCGQIVLQKAMIPVLVAEGPAHRYLCVACARALIELPTVPGDNGSAQDDTAVTAESAAGVEAAGLEASG